MADLGQNTKSYISELVWSMLVLKTQLDEVISERDELKKQLEDKNGSASSEPATVE